MLLRMWMKSWQITASVRFAILLAPLIFLGTHSGDLAYADSFPSPNQQLRDGISSYAVQCNEPLDLYITSSDRPVCIMQSTYEALLGYGVDLQIPALDDVINSVTGGTDPLEIQKVVKSAMRLYDSDPADAFATINDVSESQVSYFPFVLDPETRTIVAHGSDPDLIGGPSAVLGEFATNPAEYTIAQLEAGGGIWADYIFLDPLTGTDQLKRSWLVLHDGYIFGAGYQYSIEERLRQGIQNSIDLLIAEGERAFEIITNSKDRGKYASVFDPVAEIELANSRQPHRVGGPPPPLPIEWTELAEILRNTDEQIWTYTLFINPATGEPAQAAGLFDDHGEYILVNGYAYPADEKIRHIVRNAIAVYEADKENAFEMITDTSLDPHYPFVIDLEAKRVVAHGSSPHLVGNPATVIFGDRTEKPSAQILEELHSSNGTTIDYRFPYPGSNYEERKHSWLVLHDGYIFGSGYYQSAFVSHPDAFRAAAASADPSESDLDTEAGVQNAVDVLTRTYGIEGISEAFANVNFEENVIRYNPFVLDPATGTILIHWTSPDLVGTATPIFGDTAVTPQKLVLDRLNENFATWAEHTSTDPLTGDDSLNRSWLVLRDGYIFGATFQQPVN